MDPVSLFSKALAAALLAEASGFEKTSEAMQKLALELFADMPSQDRMSIPYQDCGSTNLLCGEGAQVADSSAIVCNFKVSLTNG